MVNQSWAMKVPVKPMLACRDHKKEIGLSIFTWIGKFAAPYRAARNLAAGGAGAHGATACRAWTAIKRLDDVTPDDLLGRNKVELDLPEVSAAYKGRSVLISGAGGSIGSELARQLVGARVRRLVLFDHSELALYTIDRELQAQAQVNSVELVPVLGSVTDGALARATLDANSVEIVLHAAAFKHVPMMESNEIPGVRNNVFGTKILAQAACEAGVGRFLLVSTDKAVRPANVMGASKRLAELVIQDMQSRSTDTVFSIVRFGNVLGSSGSVMPLFREQIRSGGPVTLTHMEMTRFFMTIPEAANLVLQAANRARGGEVFALDMGKPVRIHDLACRMITLSGRSICNAQNPGGDIELKIIGLRPGEKLFEEALTGSRALGRPHPKIICADVTKVSEIEIARMLRDMSRAMEQNDALYLRRILQKWVDGYHDRNAVLHKAM